jgi:hypothetical protein
MAFVIPATVPVNVGESIGAFNERSDVFALVATVVEKTDVETFVSKASLVKVLMGFAKSDVLSTEPNPTMAFVIPATVPVNVGESIGAFNARSDVFALAASVVEKVEVDT